MLADELPKDRSYKHTHLISIESSGNLFITPCNPSRILGLLAQLVSAPPCHGGGHRFEPGTGRQVLLSIKNVVDNKSKGMYNTCIDTEKSVMFFKNLTLRFFLAL